MLEKIRNGGKYEEMTLAKVPTLEISTSINQIKTEWEDYKFKAENVKITSVFDDEATSAANYVSEKNQELVLLSNQLIDELAGLDRDHNRHKQIAEELAECAEIIGQQTLLISIGEEGDSQRL